MAFSNKDDFIAGVKRWVDTNQLSHDQACLAMALNLAENIIRATPVDTGWARANWWPELNKYEPPPNTGAENPIKDKSSAGLKGAEKKAALQDAADAGTDASLPKFTGAFAKGKAGDLFIMSNGVPYIQRLEYDGWSKQAPNGMVRMSIKRLQNFFANYKGPTGSTTP